jgi:hypothetical protein
MCASLAVPCVKAPVIGIEHLASRDPRGHICGAADGEQSTRLRSRLEVRKPVVDDHAAKAHNDSGNA